MKDNMDHLRPPLKQKIVEWLISFHRLDPRYKILTFFNIVARDGADNLVGDESDDEYDLQRGSSSFANFEETALAIKTKNAEKLLSDIFNTSSMLTVWRPCSNDAMRKMMEGVGVGKGLDIKGKSAQKGSLSAFVPFMQIHDETDKVMIQPIGVTAKLRVYYSNVQSRQAVIDRLTPLARDDAELEDDLIPSRIKLIDKYELFGLELSQRLFWKGYVTDQDISRCPLTETGRPSTAGFQDANLKTLKVACYSVPPPSPMPVVFQYDALCENAMQPQTLVMAYEENDTVTPVVSDFDAFLLGWRREALWFGCNLPREQEDLMMWCIDHIEQILDSRLTTDTWTVRWLEILKKEASKGFIPKTPEYGFGDPKSYSIMEQAALRLIDTGAVRHGSECFNYAFPQEIDDTFLLITDTLPEKVPWKYVDVTELQDILSQKIAEGFVFPLNPKWILCDPGWKKLYDELMASDALYADLCKDVWYPPFSGVREKIEAIYKKHPKGFQRRKGRMSFEPKEKKKNDNDKINGGGEDDDDGYSPLRRNLERGVALSGNAAFALAELELENFNFNTHKKQNLAHQIRLARMEELPEHEDNDHDGEGNSRTTNNSRGALSSSSNSNSDDNNNSSHSGGEVSRRRMFRLQREDKYNSSEEKSIGTPDDNDNGNSNGKSDREASLSPNASSRRTMYSQMHSSKHDPRRNFSDILPADDDLESSDTEE